MPSAVSRLPGMSETAVASPVVRAENRFVSNRDVSCRMFRSDLFERLSHVHPVTPHVIFVPVITWLLWTAFNRQSPIGMFALVIAGLVVWTLTEYVIHRFLFHPPPHIEEDTRHVLRTLAPGAPCLTALPTWRHRAYFLLHGVHHDFPSDSLRLVMPPSVSIPLTLLFFAAFWLVFGALTPAVFAGFLIGYLYYDTTHYLTHHAPPRTAAGRDRRKRHFRHHFTDSTHDYGVSSPLWDIVLRTRGRER